MLRTLAHAFLGGGDPSAVLKGLTYGPGPWNLKEPFCSYRWGDKINDSYLSIVSIRTEVQLSRSIKCWESLPWYEPCRAGSSTLLQSGVSDNSGSLKESVRSAHAEQLAAGTGSNCGYNSSRRVQTRIWVAESCNVRLHDNSGLLLAVLYDTHIISTSVFLPVC